ncbi:porin family protein [Wenyingzhuangia sp. IMCC45574]
MKKILLLVVVAVLGISTAKGQDSKFGITAGYSSITQKFESDGFDISADESGFFIGLFTEITSSETLRIQPSLLFSSYSFEDIDGEDETFKVLQLPILAKYYLAESVYAAVGPQINYILEESEDDYTNFGINLTVGAGYEISENLSADLTYSFQLNNSYTGSEDASIKNNFFNIGLAYKF